MRIAFTHNLRLTDAESEAEFDTAETIRELSEGLRRLGHDVHPVDVTGPVSRFVARLELLRPDLVFNTAEGTHGRFREGFYPALFEQLRLPFTGSNAYVCGVTLDKQATKLLVRRAGVPTPRWLFVDGDRPLEGPPAELRYPVIVKPNFEGSSKGVSQASLVRQPADLQRVVQATLDRYDTGVLVEEFIVGRDVTVPYLEAVGVLSPSAYRLQVEGVAAGYAIYDYALKNDHPERVEVEAPAKLPPAIMERLEALTERVMRELDIRDMGRADFRVTDEGEIYFIEVNALPSLEPEASLFQAARLRGLASHDEVLAAIVESAVRRQRVTLQPAKRADALRIGLTYNMKRVHPRSGDDADAEFDSPETVAAIAAAIGKPGHEVVMLEATPELVRLLGDVELDVVFNIAEGLRGRSREAQVPALLDLMGIPYTGSDPAALAVTLDKGLSKRIVRAAGIPTARWAVAAPGEAPPEDLRYPLIVKPNAEGSSKGITNASVVRDAEALRGALAELHERYGAAALVEEFLTGREFTVGILGEVEPATLPILEVCFHAAPDSRSCWPSRPQTWSRVRMPYSDSAGTCWPTTPSIRSTPRRSTRPKRPF